MGPKWLPHEAKMAAKGPLEASGGLLGALEKTWSAKGLPGAYGAPLGGLLEASGGQKE